MKDLTPSYGMNSIALDLWIPHENILLLGLNAWVCHIEMSMETLNHVETIASLGTQGHHWIRGKWVILQLITQHSYFPRTYQRSIRSLTSSLWGFTSIHRYPCRIWSRAVKLMIWKDRRVEYLDRYFFEDDDITTTKQASEIKLEDEGYLWWSLAIIDHICTVLVE
jgi:hypothetical protein